MSTIRRMTLPLIVVGPMILIVGTYCILAYVALEFEWRLEASKYSSWQQSGSPRICRTNAEACSGSVPGMSGKYVPTGNPYTRMQLEDDFSKERDQTLRLRLSAKLELERCFSASEAASKVDCQRFAPNTMSATEIVTRISRDLPYALLAWFLLVTVLAASRLILREAHAGWRRIAVLSSAALAVVAGATSWFSGDQNIGVSIAGAFLGWCIGLALPIVGRHIFEWVRSGFPHFQTANDSSPVQLSEPSASLTWKTAGKLLLASLCICGAIVIVLTATENAVLAAIQGVGLALLGWFLSRRKRNAPM